MPSPYDPGYYYDGSGGDSGGSDGDDSSSEMTSGRTIDDDGGGGGGGSSGTSDPYDPGYYQDDDGGGDTTDDRGTAPAPSDESPDSEFGGVPGGDYSGVEDPSGGGTDPTEGMDDEPDTTGGDTSDPYDPAYYQDEYDQQQAAGGATPTERDLMSPTDPDVTQASRQGAETGIEATAAPGTQQRQAARDLETRAIRRNEFISERDQLRVAERDGRLEVMLTEEGRQDVQQRQRQQVRLSAAEELEAATGTDVDIGDVQVQESDGEITASQTDEFQREQAVSSIEEQFEERVGRDVSPGEFTIEQTEDGYTATPTSEDLQADLRLAAMPGRRDSDIFSGAVSFTEDTVDQIATTAGPPGATRFAQGLQAVTEGRTFDVPGEGSVVNVRRRQNVEGANDLTADLGPVSDLGDQATAAGQTIQQDYIQPAGEVGSDLAGLWETSVESTIGGPASSPTRLDESVEQQEQIAEDDRYVEGAKDVFRPEAEDVTVETTTERFAGGATTGALSIANVPAIAGTAVDAGEFAVEGGQRTLEGEGGEFAAEAGGQAAVVGAQATEAAVTNPAKVSGQVAGGLITSGGIIGGARRLGGAGAGRAASFAIQPGEELAITAARRGLVAGRTARAVPGVREGQVSPTSADLPSTESALDLRSPVRRVREGASEIRQRAPRVEVTRDPDSGRVSVSDPFERDLALRVGGVKRRLSEVPQQARETAVRSAVRARNLPQDLRISLGREAAVRGANVDTALVEGGVRAQNYLAEGPSIGERATDVAASGLVRGQNLAQDLRIGVGREAAVRAANVDTALVEAGVRARNLRADAPDMVSEAARRGLVDLRDAPEDIGIAARQEIATRAVNIDEALKAGGVRAQNYLADRTPARERATDVAVRGAVRAQNLRQDVGIAGRNLATGAAVSAERGALGGLVRAENLRQDVPDDLSETALETAVQAQNLRQDVRIGLGQAATGAAVSAERGALGGLVRAQNLREDAPDMARAAGVRAWNLRADLADVGVEIQPGRPARRTFEVEAGDLEVETEGTVPVFGAETGDAGTGDTFESDFESDAGEPQQAVAVARSRTETEASTETTDRSLAQDVARTEVATDPIEAGTPTSEFDVGVGSEVDVGTEAGQPLDDVVGTDPTLETGIDSRVEVGQETGIESRTEVGQEVGLDQRQEPRQETGTEFRQEPRSEFDIDLGRESDAEEEIVASGGDVATRTFQYNVATPEEVLSGDLLDGS